MRKALQERINKLDKIPKTIKDAIMAANTVQEQVDVAGAIKAVERRYRPDVRALVAETAPLPGQSIIGEVHRVEVTREAKRSYNTPNLMTKFQAEGITLLDLMNAGVLTINWRWTDLKRFAKSRGIDLKIVEKEVSTMGEKEKADIGEIWDNGSPRWS